jgi:hypothetical protein
MHDARDGDSVQAVSPSKTVEVRLSHRDCHCRRWRPNCVPPRL